MAKWLIYFFSKLNAEVLLTTQHQYARLNLDYHQHKRWSILSTPKIKQRLSINLTIQAYRAVVIFWVPKIYVTLRVSIW